MKSLGLALLMFSSILSADELVSGQCAVGISMAVSFLEKSDHSTNEEMSKRHFRCVSGKDFSMISVLNFDKTIMVAYFDLRINNGRYFLKLNKKVPRWSKILDPSYLY